MRQPPAVGKDADVLAQTALLVDDVAAHMRPFAETPRRAHRRPSRPSACSGPSGTTSRSHDVKCNCAIICHRRVCPGDARWRLRASPIGMAGTSPAMSLNPTERRFDRLQRGLGLGAVRTAGLRHVGAAAAAFAAERLGALLDQIDRVETRGEIGGDADHDAGLAVLGLTPTMATTPEPTCFLPSSARLRRSFSSMPETARANSLTSPTPRTPSAAVGFRAAAAHGELLLGVGQIALELLALIQERCDSRAGISSSGTLSSAEAALAS